MFNLFKKTFKPTEGEVPALHPKPMQTPPFMEQTDFTHLLQEAGHGFFAAEEDGVESELWKEEFGSICVTLYLDKLLQKYHVSKGMLLFTTGEAIPTEHYVGLRTIEMQSSGIRYIGDFKYQDIGVMTLEVDRSAAKKTLYIPNEPYAAFSWHPSSESILVPTHTYPTRKQNNKVVLNFAVCGEFNLSVFFVPEGRSTLHLVYSKGFCCK